jgi:prepilin-type processing-associated H-X9-DG protein
LKRRTAISLTELLVVLAILAMTTAVVAPVLFTARARSRQSACLSNLRQIGVALRMYAQENDDAFIPSQTATFKNGIAETYDAWTKSLLPYTNGTMLRCPERDIVGRLVEDPDHQAATGYALNIRLGLEIPHAGDVHTMTGREESAIRYPSLTVTTFDARLGIIALSGPDVMTSLDGIGHVSLADADPEIRAQKLGARRHHRGANYSFADGHAAWHLPETLSRARTSDGRTPGFGL